MPRLFATILIVVSLAAVPPAWAHGVLESSTPPANASLGAPPRELSLRFSERIEKAFSSVTVVDRDGRRVQGAVSLTDDGRRLSLPLPGLADGVYTVRWRVLSAVDGHTTGGFFVIAVGVPLTGDKGGARGTDLRLVVVRWIGYLAALLLAGTAIFQFAVTRAGAARMEARHHILLTTLSERDSRRLTVASALVLLISLGGAFVRQSTQLLDVSVAGLLKSGLIWPLLGGTKLGWSTGIQAAMAALLLIPSSPMGRALRAAALAWLLIAGIVIMVLGGPVAVTASVHLALVVLVLTVYGLIAVLVAVFTSSVMDIHLPEIAWVPPLTGVFLVGGITVSAHAVGGGPAAIAADWVHLLAAAAWFGGLVPLLLILRSVPPVDRGVVARVLVPRFSRLAAISLILLVITGAYSVWLNVPVVRALTTTTYGKALLVKLLFVVPMMLLGAVNRFVLRPRLAREDAEAGVLLRFVRSVRAEVSLGAIALLAVGVLTITPPSRVTMPTPAPPPQVLAGPAGDAQVRLSIAPATVGWNRFEAVVIDRDGRPLVSEVRVLLRMTKLDEDLSPATLMLRHEGQGRYVGEGGELGLAGWWEVDLIVRRRGQLDDIAVFPIVLGKLSPRPSDPDALRILQELQRYLASIQTWREVEQLSDGSGNAVVTHFEIVRPGRLHYRTSSGAEAVIIGATRYLQVSTGGWTRDTLPQSLLIEGLYLQYFRDADAVALGRTVPCDDEPCHILLWRPRGSTAAFAARIGTTSLRVYDLFMVAPGHYMVSRAFDFNRPIEIRAP